MQALEHRERVEMSSHTAAHRDHGGASNRRIALLIMVLAALLAIVEMMGKSAQNDYLARHIEASNLWSFFQAKTVRQTVLKTVAEDMETRSKQAGDIQGGIDKKIERFYAAVDRYEDEPSTDKGRKQLGKRSRETETRRDRDEAQSRVSRPGRYYPLCLFRNLQLLSLHVKTVKLGNYSSSVLGVDALRLISSTSNFGACSGAAGSSSEKPKDINCL